MHLNLRKLSSTQVHLGLKDSVALERQKTSVVVSYIYEVDRRRLYVQYGYASLYNYLVGEFKYQGRSAQSRIDAARLLKDEPEIVGKIESGDLNLTQISVVAQALRQAKGEDSSFVSTAEEKRNLLNQVQDLSGMEAQLAVAKTLNLEVKTIEKKIIQKDESIRVEMTLTKEEAAELKRIKDLISHTHPNASVKDILLLGLVELRKKKDPLARAERTAKIKERAAQNNEKAVKRKEKAANGNVVIGEANSESQATSQAKTTSPREVKSATKPIARPQSKTSQYIAAHIKREVFRNYNCCQWKNTNGKLCGSTFQLQIDHKLSRWLGGTNEESNLHLLCSAHNKLKYEMEVGLH